MGKKVKRVKAKLTKRAKITCLILALLTVVSVACYAYFISRPAPDPVPMAYDIKKGTYVHINADDFFGPFANYTNDNVVTHEYYLVYLGEDFYVVRMPAKDSKKLLNDYNMGLLDFEKGIPFTGVAASYSRELAAYGASFVNEIYEISTVTPDYFMEVVGDALIDTGRNVNDDANLFLLAAIFLLLSLFVVRSVGKSSARRKLYQRTPAPAEGVDLTAGADTASADAAVSDNSFQQGPAYEMTAIEKEMAERAAQEAAAQASSATDAGSIYAKDIYAGEIGRDE